MVDDLLLVYEINGRHLKVQTIQNKILSIDDFLSIQSI